MKPKGPHLHALALLVRDYDEAIAWYRAVLDFDLQEDSPMSPEKRWVRMAPKGEGSAAFLLAKAVGPVQEAAIGNQSGGRVFLFLYTDDIDRDLERLQTHGVEILRGPSQEVYGRVLVFKDLYGNLWDLIQPEGK